MAKISTGDMATAGLVFLINYDKDGTRTYDCIKNRWGTVVYGLTPDEARAMVRDMKAIHGSIEVAFG